MFGSSNLKLKTMEKEKTISKIQNEIYELEMKKDRYVIWVKQELTLIKSYTEDEDIWSATRTLKAHIDKIEQYKATILATECRIDSLEWVLDELNEEGGSNE